MRLALRDPVSMHEDEHEHEHEHEARPQPIDESSIDFISSKICQTINFMFHFFLLSFPI
jgi:uncharacterized membrane protein